MRLARHWPLAAMVWALVSACGEDIEFEGEPGQPTPMTLRAWVPTLEVGVDSDRARPMLVDTGAPIVTLARRFYPGLSQGANEVDLRAFGLTFPAFTAYALELFGGKTTCGGTPAGLVGGDLLRHFRLGLDYRGERAFLFYGDDDDPPVATNTAAAQSVSVEVLGGGKGELVKAGSGIFAEFEANRIMVAEVLVEGKKVNAMVDTGASMAVVRSSLLKSLGGSDRPELCCESVAVVDGVARTRISRLRSLRLGSVTVSNVPVLVVDLESLFTNLSREVGREVEMLVGGTYLRHFAVNLDYPGQQLKLARYHNQDHVSADEFVGPGFNFCASSSDGALVVIDVYQGTDASAQGVSPGDVLTDVDGQSLQGQTQQQVQLLLRKTAVGSTARLTFKTAAGVKQRQVKVERLLQDYK